jgi:hypothetical protein
MPSCDHTGMPHFHSSTTSGSASWISLRIRASVSPRQSSSAAIALSISSEGGPSSGPPIFFFMVFTSYWRPHMRSPGNWLACFTQSRTGPRRSARPRGCGNSAHPSAWSRPAAGAERRAAEEGHLDVFGEDMDAEEPGLVLDAVERRVPFHRLAHAGNGALDQRVEPAPDLAFPARHGGDIGLHRRVAVALGDLRIAARQQLRFGSPRPWRFPPSARRRPPRALAT